MIVILSSTDIKVVLVAAVEISSDYQHLLLSHLFLFVDIS